MAKMTMDFRTANVIANFSEFKDKWPFTAAMVHSEITRQLGAGRIHMQFDSEDELWGSIYKEMKEYETKALEFERSQHASSKQRKG